MARRDQEAPRGRARQLQAWSLDRRDDRHSSVAEASHSVGEGADQDSALKV